MAHGKIIARGKPGDLIAEHAGRETAEVYAPPERLAEVRAAAEAQGLTVRPAGPAIAIVGRRARHGRRGPAGRGPPRRLARGRVRAADRGGGRVRRLEPAAITGVMSREVANFRTFWKATTFSSVLEPVIYLLAFGLGLGSTIVKQVDGMDYVEFVGTGMVATAVIFSSALPAMFGTFVKHRFQRTYDAILAAPVDVEELVTAEMLWIGIRAGFYGCFPLIVAMLFGLDPAPGACCWCPLFCFITALRLRGVRDRRRRDRRRRSTSSATSRRWSSRRCSWSPARSSRSTSCRRASRSRRSSTRSTSWSSWCGTQRSGSRSTDLLRVAGLLVFALALWRDGGAAHGEAPDRLAAARLRVAQLPTAGPMTWARGCANLSHGCSSLLTPVPAPAATS